MRTYTLHTPDGKVINLHEEAAEQPELACETCRFFHDWERSGGSGQCRIKAPSLVSVQHWAEVKRHDWCGEYESKPN